jgi:hypothetical protein
MAILSGTCDELSRGTPDPSSHGDRAFDRRPYLRVRAPSSRTEESTLDGAECARRRSGAHRDDRRTARPATDPAVNASGDGHDRAASDAPRGANGAAHGSSPFVRHRQGKSRSSSGRAAKRPHLATDGASADARTRPRKHSRSAAAHLRSRALPGLGRVDARTSRNPSARAKPDAKTNPDADTNPKACASRNVHTARCPRSELRRAVFTKLPAGTIGALGPRGDSVAAERSRAHSHRRR